MKVKSKVHAQNIHFKSVYFHVYCTYSVVSDYFISNYYLLVKKKVSLCFHSRINFFKNLKPLFTTVSLISFILGNKILFKKLTLLFIVQSSDGSAESGNGHKLTFGQRLVNHLLGLRPPHQRYSVPAEYLCDPEVWASPQSSQSHLKACRAHSWGNVGSNQIPYENEGV